ncbi:hypothetical protein ACFPVX_14490 [Cohnella faecalis]|uniref:DUF2642 domain-containing protein n=1 Tax=Cohnella faecalis TaxID=2315694 RepID=A0A398CSF0_9BACL|nr:hypothetical protein [Cohnella faecalis]RIE02301.1 hypothetical protein D3H35_16390 [Cohnella faecalis]
MNKTAYIGLVQAARARDQREPVTVWIDDKPVETGVIEELTEEYILVNGSYYLIRVVHLSFADEPIEAL